MSAWPSGSRSKTSTCEIAVGSVVATSCHAEAVMPPIQKTFGSVSAMSVRRRSMRSVPLGTRR